MVPLPPLPSAGREEDVSRTLYAGSYPDRDAPSSTTEDGVKRGSKQDVLCDAMRAVFQQLDPQRCVPTQGAGHIPSPPPQGVGHIPSATPGGIIKPLPHPRGESPTICTISGGRSHTLSPSPGGRSHTMSPTQGGGSQTLFPNPVYQYTCMLHCCLDIIIIRCMYISISGMLHCCLDIWGISRYQYLLHCCLDIWGVSRYQYVPLLSRYLMCP